MLVVNKNIFYSGSKPSEAKSRPLTNASVTVENMGRMSSNKKSREMTSSNKKDSSRFRTRPPAHIDVYNNFLEPENAKSHRANRESHDALNENTSRSNNDFGIHPLYNYDSNNPLKEEEAHYAKAEDDDEIDFRPVKFNQLFS